MRLAIEKPVLIDDGEPGWCPKQKGGRRYQAEVLQEMCRRCRQKKRYCPEKVRRRKPKGR